MTLLIKRDKNVQTAMDTVDSATAAQEEAVGTATAMMSVMEVLQEAEVHIFRIQHILKMTRMT